MPDKPKRNQIIHMLREADALLETGGNLSDVIKKLGITENQYHTWRHKYDAIIAEDERQRDAFATATARRDAILEMIDRAFEGVVLGDGTGLQESQVRDCLRPSDRDICQAREIDEKQDWHRLIGNPDLDRGCIFFMNAPGIRFHLPAIIATVVTHPQEKESHQGLLDIFTLIEWGFGCPRSSDSGGESALYSREKLALLNAQQRECVANVADYLFDRWEYFDLRQAMAKFCSREPE